MVTRESLAYLRSLRRIEKVRSIESGDNRDGALRVQCHRPQCIAGSASPKVPMVFVLSIFGYVGSIELRTAGGSDFSDAESHIQHGF